jgi:uncharacterized phage protein (TIGR02220 family)
MREHRQLVTDDGALHKYRTEIPNTIIRGIMGSGLTLPARWLYVYLKSIAGDCGECWQNMTTLASGSRLSRGAVSNARKELIEAKLIAMTKGKGALHETDHIRILDIWDQNMAEFRREASSPDELGPSSLHERAGRAKELYSTQTNDSRVHYMNAPSSLHERARSPHEQPSSPDEPKKISLKKIPEKNEDLPPTPLTGGVAVMEGGQNGPLAPGAKGAIRVLQAKADHVLAYLNTLLGRNYSVDRHIKARLRKGYAIDDCKLVIDWLHIVRRAAEPEWVEKCLDHTTPFREDNFDKYLQRAKEWQRQQAGQPARSNRAYMGE